MHRLALHPALLLVVVIIPFVLLSSLVRRIRPREEEQDGYILLYPKDRSY